MSHGIKCAVAPTPAQERNPSTMHSPATRSWWFIGCWLLPLGISQAQFIDGVATDPDPAEEAAPELAFPESNGEEHPYEHVHHAYAQVLNVQPVYEAPVPGFPDHCDRREVMPPDDDGQAPREATADDAAEEAADGDEVLIEESCLPDEEIDQEPILVGYDVEYRYRGEVFISRLNEYPGDRLRIRVAIAPIELTGADGDDQALDEELLPEEAEDERQEDPPLP